MTPRSNDVVIVMPTMEPARAAATLAEARASAGVRCAFVLVSDAERRGAVVAGNVAMRAALDWGARFVCYLNDDVHGFPQGWLRRLIEALEMDDCYAVAAAGGNCRSQPQAGGRPGMAPAVVEVQQPLAWFCAVVRAEALEEVGLFDPAFIHYADESDWEMRSRQRGWRSVYVPDVYVVHERGEPVEAWYRADRARFRERWGR